MICIQSFLLPEHLHRISAQREKFQVPLHQRKKNEGKKKERKL